MIQPSLPMKSAFLNRSFLLLSAFLIFGVGAFFAFAGSTDNLSGWAWSENIGWISFNCTNTNCGVIDYGVNIDPTGNLSGYAWSEQIGWISFNSADTTGCPSSPCSPTLNKGTGRLEGWAKALVADGNGWDGWIHLSGTNYAATVQGCHYDGYAWGSDTVGWIHFKGTNYGVIGTGDACAGIYADIKANGLDGPITIPSNTAATITWESENATFCTVSPPGWTGTFGSESTGNLTSSQTYDLTCTRSGESPASDSITVNVEIPPLSAFCYVSPTSAEAGQTVGWVSTASGGAGSYDFTWHGDAPLEGKTGNPVYVSYTTLGIKSGSVTVTSGSESLAIDCADVGTGPGGVPAGPPGSGGSINITAGILNFSASPARIILGQSSTLSWSTVGMDSCSLDRGIGSVALACNTPGCPDSQDKVFPQITTIYTLTCNGSTGSASKQTTVRVLKSPAFREIYPK